MESKSSLLDVEEVEIVNLQAFTLKVMRKKRIGNTVATLEQDKEKRVSKINETKMGGRNSVNPEQRRDSSETSIAEENETEMESQVGGSSIAFSAASGSHISVQETATFGEIFKRIREFEKLKDVSTFVTFLSSVQNETLCVFDIYEITQREKLYEGRKPNRQLPCSFCGCWNIHNFLSTRIYREDVILLDNSNNNSTVQTIFTPAGALPDLPNEFKTEILRLRSVIRFMDGTTVHGTDVIGRYGTIGYIFPSTPKEYTHEIRDDVHNMLFRVERKMLAFKPAEYEVCKVSRIEVTYWVATLRTPKQGTVAVQMLSSGLPLSHKALIMAFSLYLVTFGS